MTSNVPLQVEDVRSNLSGFDNSLGAMGTEQKTDTMDDSEAQLIQLVREHKFEETLAQLKSVPKEALQRYCWEVLPLIISAIDEFQLKNEEHIGPDDFNKLIDEIISTVSAGTTHKELLIMYIESLHSAASIYVFELVLERIGDCLKNQEKYPRASLMWAVDVVGSLLCALSPPEEPKFENAEERKLMDLAEETCAITDRYRAVLKFLKSQVEFMEKHNLMQFSERDRLLFCSHLVLPLATTLGQLDLCPAEERKSPSAQHVQAVELVKIIEKISDPVAVLELAESRRPKIGDDNELKVDSLSAGVLAYMVFSLSQNFARVYSPTFLADLMLNFSLFLLSSEKQLHTLKGFALLDEALVYVECVKQGGPLQTISLRLLKILLGVMTACPLKEARQKALLTWKQLYAKYDPTYQQRALQNLFDTFDNPSVRGFILDMSRQHLAQFKIGDGDTLFRKFVFMPDGETTDLLHHSEYLLASLTYIRHLFLHRMICKSAFLESYLNEFKRALQLSRAHYDQQLNATEDEKIDTLTPNIPKHMEKEVLAQALTRFDLMESLHGMIQSFFDSA